MNCKKCNHNKSEVFDSRAGKLFIRRRRECCNCKDRITTIELDEKRLNLIISNSLSTIKLLREIHGNSKTGQEGRVLREQQKDVKLYNKQK